MKYINHVYIPYNIKFLSFFVGLSSVLWYNFRVGVFWQTETL